MSDIVKIFGPEHDGVLVTDNNVPFAPDTDAHAIFEWLEEHTSFATLMSLWKVMNEEMSKAPFS